MKNEYLLKHINLKLSICIASITLFANCDNISNKKTDYIIYPELKSVAVGNNYFGKTIIDEYQFLETDTSATIKKWINAQNKLIDSFLNKISYRDTIKKLLTDAIYSTKIRGGFPRAIDKKLFFMRIYVDSQIQKLLYKDSLNGKEIELFNTTALNDSIRKFNIDFFEPSFDGKYIAFSLSSNLDESNYIKIIDVLNKQLLPEKIERTMYGYPAWLPDGSGFFYSQLKEANTAIEKKTMYENAKIKFHAIGTSAKNDRIVFSKEINKNFDFINLDFPSMAVFPSSDKVVAYVERGSTQYRAIYIASKNEISAQNKLPISWKKVYGNEDKIGSFTLYNNLLYTISFKNNSNGSLMKSNINDNVFKENVIFEGTDEVLDGIIQTQNALYLKKSKNGTSRLVQVDFKTDKMTTVKLPFEGTVYLKPLSGISSNYIYSKDLYFGMESWDKELGIYEYNPDTKKVIKTQLRQQGKYGSIDDFVVKEIEIPSYDGTLVPLSIIYLKNTPLNGLNPTILEGYGAYGVTMDASFNLSILPWLKMGGIYAVAHVRGGGEKGELWHKGGYKSTKANSWKDFIACADYLIKQNYTSPNKLAAKGSSAGGVTVGRAITEKPELFKAVILEVSALNMLRSENSRNTFGVSEFGSVKDSLEFNYLYEMDVYHHIKKGIKYPSMLLTAGLNDTKVDWWNPAKAVARFQKLNSGMDNIILFNINTAGHDGEGDKIMEETNFYSFLLWQLNHKLINTN